MPEKQYIISLSDIDRMIVRQDRQGNVMLEFSVQLEILIRGRWHKTVRFDSSHGEPHQHTFYPDKSEFREFMTMTDKAEAFTEAQERIKASFQEINERYRALMERMVE